MKRKIALLVSILSLGLVMILPVKAAQLDSIVGRAPLLTDVETVEMNEIALHITKQIPCELNIIEQEEEDQYEYVDEASVDENADEGNDESSSGLKLAIVILAPLLVAGVVCGIFLGQMKTAVSQRAADNFITDGGVKLTTKTDQFLFKTETRTKIEKKPSSNDS